MKKLRDRWNINIVKLLCALLCTLPAIAGGKNKSLKQAISHSLAVGQHDHAASQAYNTFCYQREEAAAQTAKNKNTKAPTTTNQQSPQTQGKDAVGSPRWAERKNLDYNARN